MFQYKKIVSLLLVMSLVNLSLTSCVGDYNEAPKYKNSTTTIDGAATSGRNFNHLKPALNLEHANYIYHQLPDADYFYDIRIVKNQLVYLAVKNATAELFIEDYTQDNATPRLVYQMTADSGYPLDSTQGVNVAILGDMAESGFLISFNYSSKQLNADGEVESIPRVELISECSALESHTTSLNCHPAVNPLLTPHQAIDSNKNYAINLTRKSQFINNSQVPAAVVRLMQNIAAQGESVPVLVSPIKSESQSSGSPVTTAFWILLATYLLSSAAFMVSQHFMYKPFALPDNLRDMFGVYEGYRGLPNKWVASDFANIDTLQNDRKNELINNANNKKLGIREDEIGYYSYVIEKLNENDPRIKFKDLDSFQYFQNLSFTKYEDSNVIKFTTENEMIGANLSSYDEGDYRYRITTTSFSGKIKLFDDNNKEVTFSTDPQEIERIIKAICQKNIFPDWATLSFNQKNSKQFELSSGNHNDNVDNVNLSSFSIMVDGQNYKVEFNGKYEGWISIYKKTRIILTADGIRKHSRENPQIAFPGNAHLKMEYDRIDHNIYIIDDRRPNNKKIIRRDEDLFVLYDNQVKRISGINRTPKILSAAFGLLTFLSGSGFIGVLTKKIIDAVTTDCGGDGNGGSACQNAKMVQLDADTSAVNILRYDTANFIDPTLSQSVEALKLPESGELMLSDGQFKTFYLTLNNHEQPITIYQRMSGTCEDYAKNQEWLFKTPHLPDYALYEVPNEKPHLVPIIDINGNICDYNGRGSKNLLTGK